MRKLKTKEKNCLKGLGAAILVIGILFAIWFTQFRTTICDPDPCLNGGLCDLANRNMSKIVAKCTCPDEFTGSFCELEPCAEKPCKNNGYCSVNNKTYSFECACPNSHYGETCETSFCQPNPCESKGVCLVDEEKPGFVCDCVPGRHGKFCEIDVCNPNPCRNNGACKKTKEHEPRPEDEFTCECKTRYYGTLCEHERCSINPCKNGGKCHVYQNKEVCDCPDNTVGNFCEKKPCDGKPCKHGGICGTDKDKKTFKCKCPAGFHGKSCEKHRSIKVLTTTGMYDLNAVGKINQEGLSYPGKQIEEAIKDAGIAVFKNKAYFFGGHVDSIAILKLEGSQIKASGKKLKQSHKFSSGIQVDSEGDEVYICFGWGSFNECQMFNGDRVKIYEKKTKMSHRLGCVGLFKGDITAVGSADLNMAHSVEQLKTTTTYSRGKGGYGGWWRKRRKRWADEYDDRYWGGSRYTTTTVNWEKVSDFFNNDEPSHGKQCIGLDDESMIALGGFDNGGKSIYILKNNWEQKWVQLSSFQHAYFNPAVAAFDDVYLIVGRNSVERLYYDSYTSKAALSSFVLPIDFKSEHYLAYNL